MNNQINNPVILYYKIEPSSLVNWSKTKKDGFERGVEIGNGYFRTREYHVQKTR